MTSTHRFIIKALCLLAFISIGIGFSALSITKPQIPDTPKSQLAVSVNNHPSMLVTATEGA